jgi:hypothetical protein
MLTRLGPNNQIFVPWVEPGKGIAMTDRTRLPDSQKRSGREHVSNEIEAAKRLKDGLHLWMKPVGDEKAREVLICPASVKGWF